MKTTLTTRIIGARHEPYHHTKLVVSDNGVDIVEMDDYSLGAWHVRVGDRKFRVNYGDRLLELKVNLLVKRATGKKLDVWQEEEEDKRCSYGDDPMTDAYGFGGP